MREPHIDEHGAARMVDVGGKPAQRRVATARAQVRLGRPAMQALSEGRLAKGDALAVARIAAIQAAKRTPDLIPLCHPLAIDHASADIQMDPDALEGPAPVIERVVLIEKTVDGQRRGPD